MSRFALAAAASLTLVSGCIGSAITTGADGGKKGGGGGGGGGGDVVDMSIDPRAEFNAKVLPLITQDCGSCHAQAGGSFPPFLVAAAPKTVYDTFVAWPNLVGVTPATSEILTKPTHEGPSYADGTSANIKAHFPIISQWITDYNAVGGSQSNTDGGVVALTAPVAPTMGSVNTIKLDSLGSAFVGMSVTYTPSLIGTTELQMKDVTLVATAAAGFTVTGMVIAFYNSTDLKNTATIDTDFNQGTYTAYEMGTNLVGTTITPYTPGQYIALSFTSIVPAKGAPDMGGAVGMCKDVAGFTAFKPFFLGKDNGATLSRNCSSCHNNGTGGFNTAGFNTATNDTTSCETALPFTTPANASTSAIYKAISGGDSQHPVQLTTQEQSDFLAALTTWLNGEK